MADNKGTSAIFVFTWETVDEIMQAGGSQAWTLDAKRAGKCAYVVCCRNTEKNRGSASNDEHGAAFMIGKLSHVEPSKLENCSRRWLLRFDEFAEIDVPGVWPGNQNPVMYGDLEDFGISSGELAFQDMQKTASGTPKGLTIAQAKEGLALTFQVSVDDIQITIKG